MSKPVTTLARRYVLGFAALFLLLAGTAHALNIPKDSVGARELEKNSVGSPELKNSAVGFAELDTGAVRTGSILNGTVSILDLNDAVFDEVNTMIEAFFNEATIDTHDIVDDAVTRAKIGPGAVGDAEVQNESLSGSDILNGSITTVDLADGIVAEGSIGTTDLADGAVTTPKLANLAVTMPKLADNAVTAAKIANAPSGSDAVNADLFDNLESTAFQLRVIQTCGAGTAIRAINANGTVVCEPVTGGTGGTIEDGSVTTPKLADDAVTEAKIADGAVGPDQLGVPWVGSASGFSLSGGSQPLSFGNIKFDTGGFFEQGSSTIGIRRTGYYQITIQASATRDAETPATRIRVNLRRTANQVTTPIPEFEIRDTLDAGNNEFKTVGRAALVQLDENDQLDLLVQAAPSSPLMSVSGSIQLEYVGPVPGP